MATSKIFGIITHDGSFHSDEALAVFLLRKLPQFADLGESFRCANSWIPPHLTSPLSELTRPRDQSLLDAGVVAVDVGAVYDPERLRFDHHRKEFYETFDEAHRINLSSAGLIWK